MTGLKTEALRAAAPEAYLWLSWGRTAIGSCGSMHLPQVSARRPFALQSRSPRKAERAHGITGLLEPTGPAGRDALDNRVIERQGIRYVSLVANNSRMHDGEHRIIQFSSCDGICVFPLLD